LYTQVKIILTIRLLLTSVLVAIKYNEDDYYSNTYYAKIGGINLEEINKLEIAFLDMINWNLFIEHNFFNKYKSFLLKYCKDKIQTKK